MRATFRWIGLWVSVFVVVLCVRTLTMQAANQPSIDDSMTPLIEFIKTTSRIRLESQPRISGDSLEPVKDIRYEEAIDKMDAELSALVSRRKDDFIRCLTPAMGRSSLPTDYYEFSYSLESTNDVLALQHSRAKISNVQIERSTVAFQPLEENCLKQLLETITVEVSAIYADRLFNMMCFRNRLFYSGNQNTAQGTNEESKT